MKVSELLQLQEFLPDGFSSEQAPAAAEVFGKMSNSLAPGGRVVVIDYGLDALEFFKPERSNGTLLGYRAHKMLNDPLAIPGEQDLTAQVNFTVLREAGGKSGLRTEMYGTQEKFLTGVIQDAEKLGVAAELIGGRYLQARTLLHPQHMGRSFRVLVQQRPM